MNTLIELKTEGERGSVLPEMGEEAEE